MKRHENCQRTAANANLSKNRRISLTKIQLKDIQIRGIDCHWVSSTCPWNVCRTVGKTAR